MQTTRHLSAAEVRSIPLRMLAHLGDAVFHLHEREREILTAVSARQLHDKATSRVKAVKQAELLDLIAGNLTEAESDIVRRARNLKPSGYRKVAQAAYRKATAFEALVGFLYLSDRERLTEILARVNPGMQAEPADGANP